MALEKTLKSPLDCKEIQPVHPKGNQSWIFIGRMDTEAETPVLWPPDAKNWLIWKNPDAGKDWKVGGEGGDRGWDGWMASLTQWTWVWVTSGSWWWTERSGVLQSMRLQRVGHDWAAELNWIDHRCMGLFWSFLSSVDLYFYFCASTILFWRRYLCVIIWSQGTWFLQFYFSFSRLLWLFGIFCVSIQILKCFTLVLWKFILTIW